jgi:microcompartment protein CcmL/EutN
MIQAVGIIEFNSIAAGIEAADAMIKAASVSPLVMKTICPGKFLAGVHADVASVQAALDAGLSVAPEAAVDHVFIPNLSPAVVTAMAGAAEPARDGALGIVETFSAASCVAAADAAVKAADVSLAEVRLAMGLGGKAVCLFTGGVAAVRSAAEAAASVTAVSGLLVRKAVIPAISRELLPYIM